MTTMRSFLNPAGLARLESGEINLDLQVGGTPTILNFGSDIGGAGSNPQNLQNILQNYYGSHFEARVGLGATWVRPGWGISVMPLDLTTQADIRGVAGISAGVQAYQDTLVQFAIAKNLTDSKSLSVGIAPKFVYRAYFEKDLSILDLVPTLSAFRSIAE